MKPSPRQRLADMLLGRPVVDFISEHRDAGRSYGQIAGLLTTATDGEVTVTDEAVRQWHQRAQPISA